MKIICIYQEIFTGDGSWDTPQVWPECYQSINCTVPPPARDPSGTWEWSGSFEYNTNVTYTCGPYGSFLTDNGTYIKEVYSTCQWNKTWAPAELLTCVASSCPIVPFPPKFTGLEIEQNVESNISVVSDLTKYNPKLPTNMKISADFCTKDETFLLAVGRILSEAEDSKASFIFKTIDGNEAFHVEIALGLNTVYRYAVVDNSYSTIYGGPFDGTTIDFEEPFTIKIACDGDGWVAKINDERSFLHFIHVIPFDEVTTLTVEGDLAISFLGIGDQNMQPAPFLSFNITYKCPPG